MKNKIVLKLLSIVLCITLGFSTLGLSHEKARAAAFSPGDTIEIINAGSIGINVRKSAAGELIPEYKKWDGDRGMVVSEPVIKEYGGTYYQWWNIRWSDGVEGWSIGGSPGVEDYLQYVYVPPSTKFSYGNTVRVSGSEVSVREAPPGLEYKGSVYQNDTGRVIGGPFYGVPKNSGNPDLYHFWEIEYNGITGWSFENALEEFTPLAFDSISPAAVQTGDSTFYQLFSLSGSNFNDVDQIIVSWSEPNGKTETWDKNDSNWNAAVDITSDTSMTLNLCVLWNESSTQEITWTWTITLIDSSGSSVSKQFTVTHTPTEIVSIPSKPSGPTSCLAGISYTYSTGGSSSNLNHLVQYYFDWGDGTNSGWLPYGTTSTTKTWDTNNTWNVKAKARCVSHPDIVSGWSNSLSVSSSSVTRVISLSGSLSFGNVTIGETATRTLTITNSGNSDLYVSSISYPTGFTGNWNGGTITANGGIKNVTITFSPSSATSYGGTITVTSDKTSGTNTMACSGLGVSQNNSPVVLSSDIDTGGLPQDNVLLADQTYTVTANYYDPNGRDNLQYCWLAINHPSARMVLLWYQDTSMQACVSEGDSYASLIDTSYQSISDSDEGYQITWSFQLKDTLPECGNYIDFGAKAKDDDGNDSGEFVYKDVNASFLHESAQEPGTSTTMPATIRVLREDSGQIEEVDFSTYVKNVLPNEWYASWDLEALKAGAMAVKTYAWYWTLHQKYPGENYDVKDTIADQLYIPDTDHEKTNQAVDETWNSIMTSNGEVFQAQYDSGTIDSPDPLYPGRLSQWGTQYWAEQGKDWKEILHYYYDPIEISSNDLTATAIGLARQVIGAPYLWGGKGWDYSDSEFTTPAKILSGYDYYSNDTRSIEFAAGLDCSGLIFWAFNKAAGAVNYQVEGNPVFQEGASGQWQYDVEHISSDVPDSTDLNPGYLLYIDADLNGSPDHVGMYTGNGMMIHSVGGTGVVEQTLESWLNRPILETNYTYRDCFIGYGKLYFDTSSPPAKPVITSPLNIYRTNVTPGFCSDTVGGPCLLDVPALTYFVGDSFRATFSIANRSDEEITIQSLSVRGTYNEGLLPNEDYPEFPQVGPITLIPEETYVYSQTMRISYMYIDNDGYLQLGYPGDYHFYCALKGDDGVWISDIEVDDSLTEQDKEKDISLYNLPRIDGRNYPAIETSHMDENEEQELYSIIQQTMLISEMEAEITGNQEGNPIDAVNNLLDILNPESSIRKDGEVAEIDLDDDTSTYLVLEVIKGAAAPVLGAGLIIVGFTTVNPTLIFAGGMLVQMTEEISHLADFTELVATEIGEKIVGYASAIVTKPGVGRMEILWLKSPKDKVIVKYYLEQQDKRGEIVISISKWRDKLKLNLTENALTTDCVWNPLSQSPENKITNPEWVVDNVEIAGLHSPGEIRVYDSLDRMTGTLDGSQAVEIPYSVSFDDTIIILAPDDTYRYEIEGTSEGTYGIDVGVKNDTWSKQFIAEDVPISDDAIHDYSIDWNALSSGTSGVTISKDSDGNGEFEQTIATSPPNIPDSPSPADGASEVEKTAALSWTGGDPDAGDTVSYQVYMGTDSNLSIASGILTECSYLPDSLEQGSTLYWQVVARDNYGITTYGPVWSFTTESVPVVPPETPSIISPFNGQTVNLTPVLVSSAFSDPYDSGTHQASQWQIAVSPEQYANPVFDSGIDSVNLTSITIPEGYLEYNTLYFCRVRHQDDFQEWSEWSGNTYFYTLSQPTEPTVSDGWRIVNPPSHILTDVDFVDAANGWIVGSGGTIIHTLNGGTTAIFEQSGTEITFWGVSAVDAYHCWVVGDRGTILTTTDGGVTWTPQTSTTSYDLLNVQFLDASNGWVCGTGGIILHTTDGGTTWTEQESNTNARFQGMAFTDLNNGWIADTGGIIRHTADGGATWTIQYNDPAKRVYDIFFLDTNHGWASGYSTVLQTTDGGTTWNLVNDVTSPLKLYFEDTTTGKAASYDGKILKTFDGGATWSQQETGTDLMLMGISYPDTFTGYVVGEGMCIYKTTDAGANWQAVRPDTGPSWILGDMEFVSPDEGWAAVAGRRHGPYMSGIVTSVFHTIDGGLTWTPEDTGIMHFGVSMDFTDQNNGWIGGYAGQMIHTADGGNTWSSQITNTNEHIYGLAFVNPNSGWACGGNGMVLHTADGGTSWTQQREDTGSWLYDIYFTDENNGWAVGGSGEIIHTSNGGASWEDQVSGTYYPLEDVFFTDANNGWAVGMLGIILHTSDGGTTWTAQQSGTTFDLNSIKFADPLYGYIAGDGGTILHTADGGNTWEPMISNTGLNLAGITTTDGNHAWAAGEFGIILKYVSNEYEDFPMYTRIDPEGKVTILQHEIIFDGVNFRGTDTYVYDDKGDGYFGGNFEHSFTAQLNSLNTYALSCMWMLSNTVDDRNGIMNSGGNYLDFEMYQGDPGVLVMRIREFGPGFDFEQSWSGCSLGTPYYIKIVRDESIGDYGRLYCFIYANPERTNLITTLQLDLHAKIDFRYIYGLNTHNDSQTYRASGSVSEMLLKNSEPVQNMLLVDDDLNDNPDADFTTIQAAVNAAQPEDIILVYPGTYSEDIVITTDNLTIRSANGAEVTIVQAATINTPAFDINADRIHLQGFTIRNSDDAVLLNEAHSCIISDNIFLNNTDSISLKLSSLNEFYRNRITGRTYFGTGSTEIIFNCTDKEHYNNLIDTSNTLNEKPVYYYFDQQGQMIANRQTSFLMLAYCSDMMVASCNVTNGSGIKLEHSTGNRLYYNTCSNNYAGYFGYLGSHSNTVYLNSFSDNLYGVALSSNSGNTSILGNKISGSVWEGIRLSTNQANTLYFNELSNNQVTISSDTLTNTYSVNVEATYRYGTNTFTSFMGNYYDDYNGADNDGNGIGDTPYAIDNEHDAYPLMAPFADYEILTSPFMSIHTQFWEDGNYQLVIKAEETSLKIDSVNLSGPAYLDSATVRRLDDTHSSDNPKQLYNDGMHGDGEANDRLWSVYLNLNEAPAVNDTIDCLITYPQNPPETLSVTIDGVFTETPQLLYPADGSVTGNLSPSFGWTDVDSPDAKHYSLQIEDTNHNRVFEIYNLPAGTPFFNLPPGTLAPDTTYHWTVAVTDDSGNEAIALFDTFTTPSSGTTGEGWILEVVDSLGNVGDDTCLALDNNGKPGISYYDLANENLKYAHFNGTAWDIQTVDTIGTNGRYNQLAYDNSNNPIIVYYNHTDNTLKCAWMREGSWDISTLDSCYWTYSNAMVLDAQGYPVIAYYNYPECDLKLARFNGQAWDFEVVYDDHATAGWGRAVAMDLDASGYPGMAFRNPTTGLAYMHWNGNDWSFETIDSGYGTGADVSLRYDSTNHPCIVYYWQGDYEGPFRLNYIRFNGQSWVETLLADQSEYSSLAFDPSGNPCVSYFDSVNQDLKYATFDGSTWNTSTIDSDGNVGMDSSIVFTAGGNPVISYFDLTNGDLKIAKYGSIDINLSGDANEDGSVDVLDITKVVRIILKRDLPTPGADANNDGAVNVLDLTKIIRIILKLE